MGKVTKHDRGDARENDRENDKEDERENDTYCAISVRCILSFSPRVCVLAVIAAGVIGVAAGASAAPVLVGCAGSSAGSWSAHPKWILAKTKANSALSIAARARKSAPIQLG